MLEESIKSTVLQVLTEVYGAPLSEDVSPLDVLSSLQIYSFITLLEQSFNIKIPDCDLSPDSFDSIENIIALIASHAL